MASKRNKGGFGRPPGDYEVGYGRPPKATRFKKGGPTPNPFGCKGKPNDSSSDGASDDDFLEKRVPFTANGMKKRDTRNNLIDHMLFKQTMAGDVAACRRLDERVEMRRRRKAAQQARGAAEKARSTRSDSEDEDIKANWLKRQLKTNNGGDK